VGKSLTSLLVAIADYPEALQDGLGRERGVLADAVQLSLAPLDAETLIGPDRAALDGDGQVAGRLVLCDQGVAGTDEILGRLGRVLMLPAGRPWLSIASSLDQVGAAGDQLRVALLPLMATATLDRAGPDEMRALCAAGLAGGWWSFGAAAPSSPTCEALADAKRLLINEGNPGWLGTVSAHKNLRMLLQWNCAGTSLPEPPDSTLRKQVLLALQVTGSGDSGLVRQALARWGDRRLHLDLTSNLKVGPDDRESLRFITWLRREMGSAEAIESVLGGNLRKF
jgi:hypothetical protein